MKYAEIIVDNRASQVDRPFTYSAGRFSHLIREGMRVIVPFGKGNKATKGFVLRISEDKIEDYETKEIIDLLDDKPIISKTLIDLGLWMRDKYLCSYMDSLQTILPPGDYKEINTFIEVREIHEGISLNYDENKIIDYIKDKTILLSDLKRDLKIGDINSILTSMEQKNLISTFIDIKTTITKKYEKWIKVNHNSSDYMSLIGNRAKKQQAIFQHILENGDMSVKSLMEETNSSLSSIKSLEDKELAIIYEKEITRSPVKRMDHYSKHILNHEQYMVYTEILKSISTSSANNFLIHGITGSGKTEIYLQLVEEMIRQDKDTIILVPEISLTPQTITRFVGRFGEQVAVLHSKLSQGERFDQWKSIREGKVKIVVGARSAIFAPFKNLGLILIDEEHESTYKSSQNPKYDTIQVALRRSELEGGSVVLGSATPSIETYHEALQGKYKLLELKNRATKMSLPDVILVDMRDELQIGNRSIFSTRLYEEMKENFHRKKQTILFLNRRGFSTFVSCRSCGYVAKCDNCDISMTYHRHINKLRCHYCGKTEDPPTVCPKCGSKYIKYFGIGTEKVEEEARVLFPGANIVRMDGDTTALKGSYERILDDMKDGKIDILIGTQMISKGLDFPNVTLVGVVAADTTLNLPDFRSPEKAFQLITQVAGRSGRGEERGKVVLQTYDPQHYSIIYSKDQDFESFFKTEIQLRKEFLYPPFINLISILVYGENYTTVREKIFGIYDIIREKMISFYGDKVYDYLVGPNPAPIERIKNNFRWQIIIKSHDVHIDELKSTIKRVCILNEYGLKKDIKISIDINPQTIL